MDKWDACAFPVSEDDLEGRICYGGLDLSSTTEGAIATIMGLDRAIRCGNDKGASVYDNRGLLFF